MDKERRDVIVFLAIAMFIILTQLPVRHGITAYAVQDSNPVISEPYVYGESALGKEVTISVDVRDPDGVDFVSMNIFGENHFLQKSDDHYSYTFIPKASGDIEYKIYAYDTLGNYNEREQVFNVLAFREQDSDGDGLEDDIDSCPDKFALTPDGCPGTVSIAQPSILAGLVIAATIVFLFFKYSPDVYEYFQKRGRPPPPPPPRVRLAGIVEEEAGAKPLGRSLRAPGPLMEVKEARPPVRPSPIEFTRTFAKPSLRFRPKLMRIERPNIYLIAPERREIPMPEVPRVEVVRTEALEKPMKRPVSEKPVATTLDRLTRDQVGKDVIIQGTVKFVKTFLSGDNGYVVYDPTGKILATSEILIKDMTNPGLVYARVEEAGGSIYLRITAVKK